MAGLLPPTDALWWECCQPTCDVIHLIGPRTFGTVRFTGVGWPVSVVGLVSCWAWETLTAVLHCEHLVTSLKGRQVTLVDGIFAGMIRVVQEGILTLHGLNVNGTPVISKAAECKVWLPYRPYGGNKKYEPRPACFWLSLPSISGRARSPTSLKHLSVKYGLPNDRMESNH